MCLLFVQLAFILNCFEDIKARKTLLKWVSLNFYLWKGPQARHKCINYINFVFCFIWVKIYLVVFVSCLDLAKMTEIEKGIYSFPNFIICEALHEGRLGCFVCMGLVCALAIKQSSVQVTAGRADATTRDWCLTRERSSRSNWNTYKIMILLVMEVFHFYTGCLENSKKKLKGECKTQWTKMKYSL